MYLLPQIESLNNNVLPHYLSFFKRTLLADKATRWGDFPSLHHAKDNADFNFDALNLLSVKYLLIPTTGMPNRLASLDTARFPRRYESPQVTIVENPAALPRAYLVPGLRRAPLTPSENGLWARNVAVTEDDRLLELATKAGIGQGGSDANARIAAIPDGAVRIVSSGHARLTIEAASDGPSVLVISDAWYPTWRASVNGQEGYIGRVIEVFRGIALPEGRALIELEYGPKSLALSLWLMIGSLCAILAIVLLRGRIDRQLNLARLSS